MHVPWLFVLLFCTFAQRCYFLTENCFYDVLVSPPKLSSPLECTAKCNITQCAFTFGKLFISFSIETFCSNPSSVVHSKLTAHTTSLLSGINFTNLAVVPDDLMNNSTRWNAVRNNKNNNSVEYPWNIIHTVHYAKETNETVLYISIGNSLISPLNDNLVFARVASYHRKIDNLMCGRMQCARDLLSAQRVEKEEKFSDVGLTLKNCDAVQLTSHPSNLHLIADQRAACTEWLDRVYLMSYTLDKSPDSDSSAAPELTKAVMYVYNIEDIETSWSRLPLTTIKSFLLGESGGAELISSSNIGVGLSGIEQQKLCVSWVTEFNDENTTAVTVRAQIPMNQCEKEILDSIDKEEEEIATRVNDSLHSVCRSFANAVDTAKLRRLSDQHVIRYLTHDAPSVDINCIPTGCTDASCNIRVNYSHLLTAEEKLQVKDESHNLRVDFSIPVCHQHVILYELFDLYNPNEEDNVLQRGMVQPLQKDHVNNLIVGSEYADFYIGGSVRGTHFHASSDSTIIISNLNFMMRYCIPLNKTAGRFSKLMDNCFRSDSHSYPLIKLSTPISVCHISHPLTPDQCENLHETVNNSSNKVGSGSFVLAGEDDKKWLSKRVRYNCSSFDLCHSFSCFYSIRPSKYEVGVGDVVVNEAVVNFRFEHCSNLSRGLVVTVENFVMSSSSSTNSNFPNISITSTFNSHLFTSSSSSKLPSTEQPSKQNDDSLPFIIVTGSRKKKVKGKKLSEKEDIPLYVQPVLYSAKSEAAQQQKMLSIYFKFQEMDLIEQISELPIGDSSQCQEHVAMSHYCFLWKEAAAKFVTSEVRPLHCESNELCSGLSCVSHKTGGDTSVSGANTGNKFKIQFATCLSFRMFIDQVTNDGGVSSTQYDKGDFVDLLDMYLVDYLKYTDCFVLVFKKKLSSDAYIASVLPRTCSSKANDLYNLTSCPSDLKKVLSEQDFTVEKAQFTYKANPSEGLNNDDESQTTTNHPNSSILPMLLGLVMVPLLASLMACISICVCRQNGFDFLKTAISGRRLPSVRLAESTAFHFSSTMTMLNDEDDYFGGDDDELVPRSSSPKQRQLSVEMEDYMRL